MNRCKDCRHWGELVSPYQSNQDEARAYRAAATSQECHGVNSGRKAAADDFALDVRADDDSGLEGMLITGREFGCVRFEPRQENE